MEAVFMKKAPQKYQVRKHEPLQLHTNVIMCPAFFSNDWNEVHHRKVGTLCTYEY